MYTGKARDLTADLESWFFCRACFMGGSLGGHAIVGMAFGRASI